MDSSSDVKMIITGSTGRLGTQLLKRLSQHAYCSEFDMNDYREMERIIKKIKPETVFHLAGKIHGSKDELMRVNTKGTIELYKICKENGVKKFIFTSTAAVYYQRELKPTKENENINPQSYYGESKLKAEQELKDAVILRVFNIYGKTFDTCLVNKLYYSTEDKRVKVTIPSLYFRDYIYSQDVVEFLIKARHKRNGIYNLGTGKATTTTELIEKIPSFYTIEESDLDCSISWADITKLQQEFNSVPRRELILW